MPVIPAGTQKTIIGIWMSSTGKKANMRRLECNFHEAMLKKTKSTTILGKMLNTHHCHGKSRKRTHQGLTNIQI